jgi:hypothetical protein
LPQKQKRGKDGAPSASARITPLLIEWKLPQCAAIALFFVPNPMASSAEAKEGKALQ